MSIISKIYAFLCIVFCLVVFSEDVTEQSIVDSVQNNTVTAVEIQDTGVQGQTDSTSEAAVPFTDSLKDTADGMPESDLQESSNGKEFSYDVTIEGVIIDNETGSVPDDSIVVLLDSSEVSVDSMGEFSFNAVKKPYYTLSVSSKKYAFEQKVVTYVDGKSNYFVTIQVYEKSDTISTAVTIPADTSRIPWTITGTIIDSRFDLAIESDSTVLLFDNDTIMVTEDVNFVVKTVVGGLHTFYLYIPGYHSVTYPVTLEEKEKQLFITIPTTILSKSITRREITVSAKRLPVHRSAQVGKIEVPRKELQRTAATINDPIRVLHTLPGVASESDVTARPIVQGGDVDEARVFLDGVPLLQPYHYGGVRSMFNQQGIDGLTLYKSGFPAEMHNAQSALIDVSSRVPSDEKPSFEFDLNLLQYATYLGFPLFKGKVGVNFSSQGSFHDQILKLITNVGGRMGNKNMEKVTKLVNIPDYKDFTAGISICPSSRLKIFVNEMLNSDRTKFTSGDSMVNVTYKYYTWDQWGNRVFDTSVTVEENYYSPLDTSDYIYREPLPYRRHDGNLVIGEPWLDIDTIIDYKSKFNVLYAKLLYIPSDNSIVNTTIAWQKRWWDLNFPGDYNISDDLFGKNRYDIDLDQFNLNSGWTYSGLKNHLIKAGVQLDYTSARYDVHILRYLHRIITSGSTSLHDFWGAMNGDTARVFEGQNEDILYTLMDRILVSYKGDRSFANVSAYCSDGWDLSGRLHLDVGTRVEYSRADHATAISPRFTLKCNLSEKNELLGSIGHYTQNNYEIDVIALSEKLKPEKIWHGTAGIETKILPWLTQKIDLYGKYYYDLASEIIDIVDVDEEALMNYLIYHYGVDYFDMETMSDALVERLIASALVDLSTSSSRYTNEGKGTAFGFEYLLRFDPTDFWHGWISLSLGKSVRWRRKGWRKHPFPLDRPLLISINNYYRLPRKYEISLKYRYMSGLPYTSVRTEGSTIYVGDFNDSRYKGYQRFDIRFSKGFSVKSVKGNFYTEIWSAFNSPNLFGIDSKTKDYITILPNFPVTIPYIGIECIF